MPLEKLTTAFTQTIKLPGMMARTLDRLRASSDFSRKIVAMSNMTSSFIRNLRSHPEVCRRHSHIGTYANRCVGLHSLWKVQGSQSPVSMSTSRTMAERPITSRTTQSRCPPPNRISLCPFSSNHPRTSQELHRSSPQFTHRKLPPCLQ